MLDIKPYKVYIKTDNQNRITAINSDAFLSSLEGWIEIDSGFGDKYHHAQGNYFPLPIYDERGIMRYLYMPEAETLWRERTQEEMDADYIEPKQVPTQNDIIEAQVTYTAMMTDTLLEV